LERAVAIVGAGPAGLAVAACLHRRGVPYFVLEKGNQVAPSWHRHYDRLHLHTDKAHSGLPGMPFPPDAPRYPPRAMVVQYLQAYAQHFGIEPKLGQPVVSARKGEHGGGTVWAIRTPNAEHHAGTLVVATGHNSEPVRPTWPGMDAFAGSVIHSADYKNGAALRGRRVLVVGLGNSGGEICLDLHEHGARPTVAVRSPVNVIPREVFGVPFLSFAIAQSSLPAWLADALNAPVSRWRFGDLRRHGLRRPAQGPMTQIREQGRVPFIDVGTVALIKSGALPVRPGIDRFTTDGVVFTDGTREVFDAVVLATGYRPRLDAWLHGADAALRAGRPVRSGSDSGVAGLYFCGFHVSATGMLREIGIEAERLANAISLLHRSAA
jgi:indole-3-pyruvate monooxygenase